MTNGGCLIIPEISYAITPPVTMWSMGKLKLGWKMRRLPSPSPNAPQDMSCQTWPEHHQSHSQQPAVPTLLSPDRIHLTQSDPRLMDSWMEFGDSSTCGSVLEWDNQWVVWGVLTWRVTLVTSWSPVTRVPQFPSQQHFSPAPSASGWAVTSPDYLRTDNVTITPIYPPLCNLTRTSGRDDTYSRAFSKKMGWQITHHRCKKWCFVKKKNDASNYLNFNSFYVIFLNWRLSLQVAGGEGRPQLSA